MRWSPSAATTHWFRRTISFSAARGSWTAMLSPGPLCRRGIEGRRRRPGADRSRRRGGERGGRGARVLEHPRDQRGRAQALRQGRRTFGLHSVSHSSRWSDVAAFKSGRLDLPQRKSSPMLLGRGSAFGIWLGRQMRAGSFMVSRRLTRRSLAIAKANAQAGADAVFTIAARTQNLLAPGGRQSDKAREARLMVQEKVDAAIEGALAAQAAWGAFSSRRRLEACGRRATCRPVLPRSQRPPWRPRGAKCAPMHAV